MNDNSMKFLKRLTEVWGPAGFEENVRKLWKEELNNRSDKIETDYHGNITAVLKEDKEFTVVLAGHIDEIGFMVTYIENFSVMVMCHTPEYRDFFHIFYHPVAFAHNRTPFIAITPVEITVRKHFTPFNSISSIRITHVITSKLTIRYINEIVHS